jgi:hypothetical protein
MQRNFSLQCHLRSVFGSNSDGHAIHSIERLFFSGEAGGVCSFGALEEGRCTCAFSDILVESGSSRGRSVRGCCTVT